MIKIKIKPRELPSKPEHLIGRTYKFNKHIEGYCHFWTYTHILGSDIYYTAYWDDIVQSKDSEDKYKELDRIIGGEYVEI